MLLGGAAHDENQGLMRQRSECALAPDSSGQGPLFAGGISPCRTAIGILTPTLQSFPRFPTPCAGGKVHAAAEIKPRKAFGEINANTHFTPKQNGKSAKQKSTIKPFREISNNQASLKKQVSSKKPSGAAPIQILSVPPAVEVKAIPVIAEKKPVIEEEEMDTCLRRAPVLDDDEERKRAKAVAADVHVLMAMRPDTATIIANDSALGPLGVFDLFDDPNFGKDQAFDAELFSVGAADEEFSWNMAGDGGVGAADEDKASSLSLGGVAVLNDTFDLFADNESDDDLIF